MRDYSVVSISSGVPTQWYYLYNHFFESLKRHSVQPIVFQPDVWGGLATKPKALYAMIKNGTIKTPYIIFSDCWDLVFSSSPDEIFSAYKDFEAAIVISAEKNCFPADTKNQYDSLNAPTIYKYLNSGFIVGNTDAILTCLEAMDLQNLPDDYYDPENNCNVHPNDQFEWQKIFLKQPVKIKLDHFQELSQTLHDANIFDFDFTREKIRNNITGSRPMTWHFNGGSKDNMSLRTPILNHLKL